MPKYRESNKSEMDSQRELLDNLMGINRNNDRKKDDVRDFRDDRVCKFFLTGMCPHDIFVNTKMDQGPCPKIHSDSLKKSFEDFGDLYMYDNFVEREFSFRIQDADRIIKKARLRVEDDKIDEELNPEINPDILRVHDEMSRVIEEAEKAGEKGDIDTAQELILTRLDDLQKEKNGVMSKINELKKQKLGGPDKKLRVCDVCGSYLSILDSDKRLSDHFMGKQHIGFQYMRDTLEAIKKRREDKSKARDQDRNKRAPERRDSSRSRDRQRRRDDSRDRREKDFKRRDDSRGRDYRR